MENQRKRKEKRKDETRKQTNYEKTQKLTINVNMNMTAMGPMRKVMAKSRDSSTVARYCTL